MNSDYKSANLRLGLSAPPPPPLHLDLLAKGSNKGALTEIGASVPLTRYFCLTPAGALRCTHVQTLKHILT